MSGTSQAGAQQPEGRRGFGSRLYARLVQVLGPATITPADADSHEDLPEKPRDEPRDDTSS